MKSFQFRIINTIYFQWIIMSSGFFMTSIENCWVIWFILLIAIWYFTSGVLTRRLKTTSDICFKVLMNTYNWSIVVVDKLLVYMGLYLLLYCNLLDSLRYGTRSYQLHWCFTYWFKIWKCDEWINSKNKMFFKNKVTFFRIECRYAL